MKINLGDIDKEQFYVNEHKIGDEVVFLVTPKEMGCEWSQENKIFRSSVWNSKGELISASFPKFVNYGEKPEVFPVPTSLNNTTIVEKVDGSTLIVSKYKGQFIKRTRGSMDATQMEKNGFEIELLMDKYPTITKGGTAFYNSYDDDWSFSLIFEWVSPINKIVLSYNEADIKLIGIIDHHDYSLWTQVALNGASKQLGVSRPKTYTFNTITDLITTVQSWVNLEGVCWYHSNGQSIHKIKSYQYLKCHAFKSNLSINNTMEMWFELNKPDYDGFMKLVTDKFDWECAKMVEENIKKILAAYDSVKVMIDQWKLFVTPLKSKSRKDAAEIILTVNQKYSSYLFKLLSNKELEDGDLKKIIVELI